MPSKDGEFIAWTANIYEECAKHATEWVLSMPLLTQFGTLYEIANSTYLVNSNKEHRNKATATAKDAAFLALKQFLTSFVNLLEGNLSVPDEAIDAMGLRPRHKHANQPIPVPTETPVLTAVVGQHHDIVVYISTLQHGHPTAHLRNGIFAGFILKYKVEGEEQWQTVISTKLHHTLIFSENEEGKHILLQAAWVNPRIQNGPWSEEVQELIN
jgi:hypothetical protein